MIDVTRYPNNPIISPHSEHDWEAKATFNGCAVKNEKNIYLLYRGLSHAQNYHGKNLELSTIGIAESNDGLNFNNRTQFIQPEHDWEKFGCEDPRVTKFNDKYFIFYTAISDHPPNQSSIKVAVAVSNDLKTISEKHLVTPFNAKAMVLFPRRINGKITALLTAQTDQPPANITLAQMDNVSDLWNEDFWNQWYEELELHTLRLARRPQDHVEIGAPPIKTKHGWLLIYSYINNYFDIPKRIFNIEAMLLDLKKPKQIIGRSKFPLLIPEKDYELHGIVPNIVFPSGALIKNETLNIYYGGADTHCCVASCSLKQLLKQLRA
jgi:predicted GH43/DUF377 family glycosyl hydrolase